MALSCSSFTPPIPRPNFQRNYAIQKPFTSKTPNFEFLKFSISAPAKVHIKRGGCRSSLSTPVELDDGPPSNVIIFIKGLAKSTVEGGLKTTFSQYGEVTRVKVVTDKKSKQSLGFAYVWFMREEHAQAAVNTINGQGCKALGAASRLVAPCAINNYEIYTCDPCKAQILQNSFKALQVLKSVLMNDDTEASTDN